MNGFEKDIKMFLTSRYLEFRCLEIRWKILKIDRV